MKTVILSDQGVKRLFDLKDANIHFLESLFSASIGARGSRVTIQGSPEVEQRLEDLLQEFSSLVEQGVDFSNGDLKAAFHQIAEGSATSLHDLFPKTIEIKTPVRRVVPKTPNQMRYLEAMASHDVTFGIGPAGTGKTYLAVATAISLLLEHSIDRIILSRPAVEAGERLGFLPGDLQEKVNPYLRPLYDALFHMLSGERVEKLMERGTIEIAPLAFMRGRTLSNAFIILDEAQNCTSEQMKMFLTRIGLHSKAVITGDVTQIDLPREEISGLVEANTILEEIPGIAFCWFDRRDVVRHAIVKSIIRAYEANKASLGDSE